MAGAASLLESLGHHVEQSAPAAMFEPEIARHFNTIIAADTEATMRAFEMLLGRPIGEDEIEPRNAAYRRAGSELGAADYLESRAWIGMWARRMADWWTSHDLLLTPTLGAPPPELGWFTAAGPEEEGARIASFIPYTPQFNMTGQPAVSLPLHWTPGRPAGRGAAGRRLRTRGPPRPHRQPTRAGGALEPSAPGSARIASRRRDVSGAKPCRPPLMPTGGSSLSLAGGRRTCSGGSPEGPGRAGTGLCRSGL